MKFLLFPIKIFFLLFFFSSCSDTLSFDQVDIDIEPIVNVPIVYFELNQNDFFDVNNGIEISSIADITDFDILQLQTFQEKLIRADFNFEIINRFDRSFQIKVEFLDSNGNQTFSLSDFNVSSRDLNYSATRSIIVQDSPRFLNSTKLRVQINLFPSSNLIDPTISNTLVINSAGTFFLSF